MQTSRKTPSNDLPHYKLFACESTVQHQIHPDKSRLGPLHPSVLVQQALGKQTEIS